MKINMIENSELNPGEQKILNEIGDLSRISGSPCDFKGKEKKGNTYYYEAENGNVWDLNLNSAGLEQLPDNIGDLKSLKSLTLRGNKLTELPESIGNLIDLEYLILEDNDLKFLPETIGNLENLKELNLKSNRNIKLSNSLGNLKSLKKIDMGSTKITNFPEFITRLESLESLDLGFCEVESLPESIGNLRSLIFLELQSNKLIILPDSICKLTALQKLDIWQNEITTLPKSIGNLKSLKELNCHHNEISKLPESIGNLESLEIFNINWNRSISNLPDSIGNLKNLKNLQAAITNIEKLPESIGNLGSLVYLNLNFAKKLSSLPRTIGKLKNLKSLYLEDNSFKNIPKSIWPLKELKELSFKGNPLDEEAFKLLEKPIPAILEYCRNNETINVFLSHAVADFDYFNIQAIAEYLKDQNEIYLAYFCEEDLIGGIDAFMNNKVPDSQLMLFFASHKSVFDSKDCAHELELARKNAIQIIPIKGADVNWEDLANIGLSRDLGFEYNETDLSSFCQDLFNYIVKFKAEVNLFESENARIGTHLFNIKNTIENLGRSKQLQELVKNNMKEIEILFTQLNKDEIKPIEYLKKFFDVIFQKQ